MMDSNIFIDIIIKYGLMKRYKVGLKCKLKLALTFYFSRLGLYRMQQYILKDVFDNKNFHIIILLFIIAIFYFIQVPAFKF